MFSPFYFQNGFLHSKVSPKSSSAFLGFSALCASPKSTTTSAKIQIILEVKKKVKLSSKQMCGSLSQQTNHMFDQKSKSWEEEVGLRYGGRSSTAADLLSPRRPVLDGGGDEITRVLRRAFRPKRQTATQPACSGRIIFLMVS